MSLQLPSSIASLQDIQALELEVREYAKWFSHNDIKHKVHAKRGTPPPVISPGAQELLKAWTAKKSLSVTSLGDLANALTRLKDTAPTATITLAAPPTRDIKHQLTEWCRAHIEPNILVSFQFNETILGGLVVRYKSRVFDWSFRRTILAEKSRFPKVLRDV